MEHSYYYHNYIIIIHQKNKKIHVGIINYYKNYFKIQNFNKNLFFSKRNHFK